MLCDPVHQDEAATDTYFSPSSWACHGQPGEFRGPEWFKIMNMFLLSFSHSHVNFDCCHATSLKVSRSGFRQEEGRMGSQHSLCWYMEMVQEQYLHTSIKHHYPHQTAPQERAGGGHHHGGGRIKDPRGPLGLFATTLRLLSFLVLVNCFWYADCGHGWWWGELLSGRCGVWLLWEQNPTQESAAELRHWLQ